MNDLFFNSDALTWSEESLGFLAPYLWICFSIALAVIAAAVQASLKNLKIIAAVAFVPAALLFFMSSHAAEYSFLGGTIHFDFRSKSIGLALSLISLLCVLLFKNERKENEVGYGSEWLAIMLVSFLGMIILPATRNWVSFFVALETLSIPAYILAATEIHRKRSLESGAKYLLLGSFASGFLLMGLAFLYGQTGTFDFSGVSKFLIDRSASPSPMLMLSGGLIVFSIAFKLALAPLHMWSPDVYQGAPTPIAAFLTTSSKISVAMAGIIALNESSFFMLEFLVKVSTILAIFSVLVGSIMAFSQVSVKRLMAYSGVVNAGYLFFLFPLGIASANTVFNYFLIYSLAVIILFAVVQHLVEKLGRDSSSDLLLNELPYFTQNKKLSMLLQGSLIFSFFSMLGIPPLPGFFAKYQVIIDLWEAGSMLPILFILIGTFLGLAYYLKIFSKMYFQDKEDLVDMNTLQINGNSLSVSSRAVIATALVFSLLLFCVFLG